MHRGKALSPVSTLLLCPELELSPLLLLITQKKLRENKDASMIVWGTWKRWGVDEQDPIRGDLVIQNHASEL